MQFENIKLLLNYLGNLEQEVKGSKMEVNAKPIKKTCISVVSL